MVESLPDILDGTMSQAFFQTFELALTAAQTYETKRLMSSVTVTNTKRIHAICGFMIIYYLYSAISVHGALQKAKYRTGPNYILKSNIQQ